MGRLVSKPTIVLPIAQIHEIAFLCKSWAYFVPFWDQWDVFLR